MPLTIARRCVPFTPFEKDLATATVALVSATGVFTEGQEPFPEEDPGDITYRVIPADTEAKALKITATERLIQGPTRGHPAQLGGVLVVAPGGEVVWSADDLAVIRARYDGEGL